MHINNSTSTYYLVVKHGWNGSNRTDRRERIESIKRKLEALLLKFPFTSRLSCISSLYHTQTDTDTHTHTYIHIDTHVHTHIHIQTHTNTYKYEERSEVSIPCGFGVGVRIDDSRCGSFQKKI